MNININKLLKVNLVIFASYGIIFLLNYYFSCNFFSFLKIILGITIFLTTGLNSALLLKNKAKLSLDATEISLISLIMSFFFIPLIIFILYKITGSINGWINISIYFSISLISLLIIKYQRNER